ncbi:pyridoxal-phosphate dependent enzyme [Nocardia vulneris]|uniref:pyridoxal-phosphate dependent enzyme n=1 Tax=Nocardia vulneris TaxID=1141657 RepID=UPI0030CF9292
MTTAISVADIRDAALRLTGAAHWTPVLSSRTLDDRAGAEVLIKCENFQRTGAFKYRGAYNAISRLSQKELARGVSAFSSGNHSQAVALVARQLGTSATILMPEDTPRYKIEATRGYGAEIVTYDRYTQDRVALGTALAREHGMTLIPPYDNPHVISGQGTVAMELFAEAGRLDVLVVPVGGGGLIAGSAMVAKLQPGVRVIGVEPVTGDDTRRSLAAGERVRIPVTTSIADGLAAEIPGELTFSINLRLVDRIVTVSDEAIRDAMRFAFERLKIVIEPSAAVGLAAIHQRLLGPAKRVGVIVSGGNISAQRFAELTADPAAKLSY